ADDDHVVIGLGLAGGDERHESVDNRPWTVDSERLTAAANVTVHCPLSTEILLTGVLPVRRVRVSSRLPRGGRRTSRAAHYQCSQCPSCLPASCNNHPRPGRGISGKTALLLRTPASPLVRSKCRRRSRSSGWRRDSRNGS